MDQLDIGITIIVQGTLYQGIATLQPAIQQLNNQPEPAQPAQHQSPTSEQDAEGEEEEEEEDLPVKKKVKVPKGGSVTQLSEEDREIYRAQEREKKQKTRWNKKVALGIHSKTIHLTKK